LRGAGGRGSAEGGLRPRAGGERGAKPQDLRRGGDALMGMPQVPAEAARDGALVSSLCDDIAWCTMIVRRVPWTGWDPSESDASPPGDGPPRPRR
jgi:hypothetical protein